MGLASLSRSRVFWWVVADDHTQGTLQRYAKSRAWDGR